jgi:membrane-associated protease RseP (regulator of RpoE activity)
MQHGRNIILGGLVGGAFVVGALWTRGLFAENGAATAPSPAATGPGVEMPAAQVKTQFWFGVAVENIPPAIARQLKLNANQGLMVYAVLPDSPAQKAGLQAEDILCEINGRPLTSQDDLFRAANPSAVVDKRSNMASKITYLRGGNPTTVDIVPARRPAEMIIFGDTETSHKVLNYVAPTGGGAQIGPGMRIDLSSEPSNFTIKSIKAIVSKGQTIILSQESDAQGGVKNTITVGSTTYTVDPLHMDALPGELRPFAEQLVGVSPLPPAAVQSQPAAKAPVPGATASLEHRLKDLESQNAQLQQRVKELEKERGR